MDELLGRKTPYSSEAEQAVIGSILLDPHCFSDVIEKLRGDEFYFEQNREIFETISYMYSHGEVIDIVTVLDRMRTRGCLKDTTRQYVLELVDVTPTAANVGEYCAIVRDKALLRSLGSASSEISDTVYKGPGDAAEALELAERKIFALRKNQTIGGLVPISNILPTVVRSIQQAAESDQSFQGLSTGLRDVDSYLLGMGAGDFVLIASRPGMGKTSIALNMAVDAAKTTGKTIAIFSLEMSKEQLVTRILSSESAIDNSLFTKGLLKEQEWKRLTDACGVLSALDIRVNDTPTTTVSEMNAQCRRLENLGLVVIDYLQLMQDAGSGYSWSNESRTQAVSDISRMMKIMAKELGVPVICLSQLSRASETRQNKRPVLSDLRESGSIEQDADIVIGLYREAYYNREAEDPFAAEAIILKNRHGRCGTVNLRWQPEFTSYYDAEQIADDYE